MSLGGLVPDATPVNVAVILVATAVIWIGSAWLENSAEALSTHYGLPPVIQGSVVVAVGSSFPEFASVVVTAFAGVFEMGVGTIVGSAIFNILVVPALSGIATDDEIATNRAIVFKEAQFYMIAVSALVISFALAVIYAPVPAAPGLTGEITRPIAAIPLALYGMYLFIQWEDVADYEATPAVESVDVRRNWLLLLGGLVLIAVAIQQFVEAIDSLGETFGVPEFISGVLIIAAATSLPDTLVSVRAAREGRGITSLANVLGSNTFNLLVAIPVGVFIVGGVPIDFAVAAPMMGLLTVATMLLFVTLRTDLSLTPPESYLLVVTYAAFVVWMITETLELTDLIGVP